MDPGLALVKGALGIGEMVLGVVVWRGRVAWQRVAGALFVLNGFADLDLLAQVSFPGLAFPNVASDLATGPLLILLAIEYPHGLLAERAQTTARVGLLGLAAMLGLLAFVASSDVLQVLSWLTTFPGYALFLTFSVPRVLRGREQVEPGTGWVLAGFTMRMAEFVPAFAFIVPRALAGAPWWVALEAASWLWLASAVIYVALLIARQWRAAASRVVLEPLAVAMMAGLLLGLARSPLVSNAVGGAAFTPARNILARLSVSLLRPLFVAIGVLGGREVALSLVPLLFTAAAAMLGIVVLPALAGSGLSGLATLLLGLTLSLLGLLLGVRVVRLATRTGDSPATHARDRRLEGEASWIVLLLELSSADPKDDEARTRPRLAEKLGVPARNLHRVVEQVEKNGRDPARPDAVLIRWELKRGRGGQRKYFYSLTAEGEEAASRARGSILANSPRSAE
jgi:hypothetical protein